ncbi:site-specific DNA-methyltransferase [Roseospira marina]|uniref:site-specific DNA-methyltransferase (adenine-specific) n=1 Tax=Roseospira marina TaxID=140057 RepID=A0A5M6I2E3_9PROT|nr:site-specific DNA-methyltransferase [Roseospira marina]KAA5602333.1 site-specific DNA-methyltransferase [Roseospira marina]MBB4315273.1 site-specific DNA-methyltransferase (adenine-specific) [Roseospira marina]MBB5088273.1 site-specific DNA-methyltransferase (adenine-specific) [Roseospira marina]
MPEWTHLGAVSVARADALDALASLPAASLHAIITDPPYCAGGSTEAARQSSRGMTRTGQAVGGWFQGDAMTTFGLCWLMRSLALAAGRALVPGGSLAAFGDWRMVPGLAPALESAGYRWRATVIWDKLSPGQGTAGVRPRHETILWLTRPGPVVRGPRTIGTVIPARRVTPATRRHPTEKPQDLLVPLVEALVPEGGAVADPFAGSGSLGCAAVSAGRRAWLSDGDPTHVATMLDRFSEPPQMPSDRP